MNPLQYCNVNPSAPPPYASSFLSSSSTAAAVYMSVPVTTVDSTACAATTSNNEATLMEMMIKSEGTSQTNSGETFRPKDMLAPITVNTLPNSNIPSTLFPSSSSSNCISSPKNMINSLATTPTITPTMANCTLSVPTSTEITPTQTRPTLTEEMKRANHVESEKKRRANIKLGFAQLAELVPTIMSNTSSEAVILEKAIDYIEDLNLHQRQLLQHVQFLCKDLNEPIPLSDIFF